jgi:hypothetical protein
MGRAQKIVLAGNESGHQQLPIAISSTAVWSGSVHVALSTWGRPSCVPYVPHRTWPASVSRRKPSPPINGKAFVCALAHRYGTTRGIIFRARVKGAWLIGGQGSSAPRVRVGQKKGFISKAGMPLTLPCLLVQAGFLPSCLAFFFSGRAVKPRAS